MQSGHSGHPIRPRLAIPFRRHLLGLRPEFYRTPARNVAYAKPGVIPPAKRERLARYGHADIHADHPGLRVFHHMACNTAALREDAGGVSVRRGVLDLERL